MTKRKKVLKIILRALAFVLASLLVIVGILFFPLPGKKHVEIWSASDTFALSALESVEKQADAPFKILMIADIQLWASPSDNKAAYEQVKALVAQTQPNLIVTLGDNVSGATTRYLLKNFIKLMDAFEIPWAPVFGNHDSEIPMTTLNWQGDKFSESAYCLFKKGPSNLYGCGNYAVNITENGKPIQTLFFFDNGRYIEYDDGATKEVYMGYEQIAWYAWNVEGIARETGSVVPSMTFSHFAQPEFRAAVEEYGIQTQDGGYTIPEAYGFGSCQYLPCAAPVSSGFFEKCKALGSTKYIFCGHDHENDASITIDGITMQYGLKTGPSPAPWNGAEHTGGTLVTIGNADTGYAVSRENIVMD